MMNGINSGCSHHMTRRKEKLREFQSLTDGGCVKYGNNSYGTIKGYGMIPTETSRFEK